MTASKTPLGQRVYGPLAERYAAVSETKAHNVLYERPATFSLLPPVKGLRVLDAGCGPGVASQILAEQGATVTAIDVTPEMVAIAARRLQRFGIVPVRMDLEQPLSELSDNSFDLVVSSLVFDYVRDLAPLFGELHRVLKVGGHLVFSMSHPAFEWMKFGKGRYYDASEYALAWTGFGDPKPIVEGHLRPLQDVLNPLVAAGFVFERLLEPEPSAVIRSAAPQTYESLNQRPCFMCIRARKG